MKRNLNRDTGITKYYKFSYDASFRSVVFLDGSPAWVQHLAKFMPLWHVTNGMRRIMHEGAGLIDLYSSILSLLGIGLVFLTLGA